MFDLGIGHQHFYPSFRFFQGADHDPARRRAGAAALLPRQPAARPHGQAAQGGHTKVLNTPLAGEGTEKAVFKGKI